MFTYIEGSVNVNRDIIFTDPSCHEVHDNIWKQAIRFGDGTEHASCLEWQCNSCVFVFGSNMNSSTSFS